MLNTENQYLVDELQKYCRRPNIGYNYVHAINNFIGSIHKHPLPVTSENCKSLSGCGDIIQKLVKEFELKRKRFGNSDNNNSNSINNNNSNVKNKSIKQDNEYMIPASFKDWLESINYIQYYEYFISKGFDTIRHISLIDESILDRNIFPEGHARLILAEVKSFKSYINNNNINLQNIINNQLISEQQSHLMDYVYSKNNNSYNIEDLDNDLTFVNSSNNNNNDISYDVDNDLTPTQSQPCTPVIDKDIEFEFQTPELVNYNTDGVWPILSDEVIKKSCDESVFHKSIHETIFSHRIKSISLDRTTLKATVLGTAEMHSIVQPEYQVEMEFKSSFDQLLFTSCTCHYRVGIKLCKHRIGILNYLKSIYEQSPPQKNSQDNPHVVDSGFYINGEIILHGKGTKRNKSKNNREEVIDDNSSDSSSEMERESNKRKKKTLNRQSPPKKSRDYIPKFRSGAWAIMSALYISTFKNQVAELKKNEILALADPYYTDQSSSAKSNIESGWNGIKTLESNDLVTRSGNPPLFKLTPKGLSVAMKINQVNNGVSDETSSQQSSLDVIELNQQEEETEKVDDDLYHLKDWSDSDDDLMTYMLYNSPLSLEEIKKIHTSSLVIVSIQLLVDNREIKKRNDNSSLLSGLAMRNIQYDLRSLPLGDFLWVAKAYCSDDPNKSVFEVVFNAVVERKRLFDLQESHRDGRYAEQKYRLARCGITNVFYLIEGDNSEQLIKADFYENCLVETNFYDQFRPITTDDEAGTITFLENIYRMFEKNSHEYLTEMVFESFVERSEHAPLPVRGYFSQTLLSINGMTQNKAIAILKKYPTQKDLYDAYNKLIYQDESTRAQLLSNLPVPDSSTTVGPSISRLVYEIFY